MTYSLFRTSIVSRVLFCFVLWSISSICPAAPAKSVLPPHTVFLEAEGFADHGGWILDQQYMDQMGSPVLLAHGLGVPVKDASTEIVFPVAGKYRIYVRTRNWVAPWTNAHAPGRFRLLLDDRPLETVYGTEGDPWHWQRGDEVEILGDRLKRKLSLRDLTGFDGRVDAICLTADPGFVPPEETTALDALRRRALGLASVVPDAEGGPFDLVVVGAGYPGICAAVTGARLGLKVALIQDRPYVGGNASPEIGVGPEGVINLPPYPNLGNLVYQLRYAKHTPYEVEGRKFAQKEMALILAEENITLFLAARMIAAETDDGNLRRAMDIPAAKQGAAAFPGGRNIRAVIGKNIYTGKEWRIAGTLFADCTGDANLGFLAGADFRVGRESKKETGESMAPEEPDRLVMGSTLTWQTVLREKPTRFPELPWAVRFSPETIKPAFTGYWNWETGMNMDQVADVERLRDLGFRAIYGHWDYMKNKIGGEWGEKVANRDLRRVDPMAGKRESRRLLGDHVYCEQDITENKRYPDSCVICTWPIDLHYADDYSRKYFPGDEFRTYCTHVKHEPCPLPYRCFYSRNVPNLFMAGRDISVTHVGLGVARVIQTGGMMGEVVGMAASVCKKNGILPRGVYEKHLSELIALMEKGIAPAPPAPERAAEWTKTAGPNLARKAKAAASSEHTDEIYKAININDGRYATTNNNSRWVSRTEKTPWVVLAFDKPTRIDAFQMVTGQSNLRTVVNDCVLQYEKDGRWLDIPGAEVRGNEWFFVSRRFEPVEASRYRLWITKTAGNMARIWELELYCTENKPK